MKPAIFVLSMLIAAMNLSSQAATKPLTGPEVLARSRKAYQALKSYQGTTQVRGVHPKSEEDLAEERKAGKRIISGKAISYEYTYESSAEVWFLRPDRLRVEGRLSRESGKKGDPFCFISKPGSTWSKWSAEGVQWKKVDSAENAIAGFTGVSSGAATTIPALLLETNWGYPFGRQLSRVELAAKIDSVDGHPSYRVQAASPTGETTFWVDKTTFLLRRIVEKRDQRKLDEMVRESTGGRYPDGVDMPVQHWPESRRWSVSTETFTWTALNKPIPASKFTLPAKAPTRK